MTPHCVLHTTDTTLLKVSRAGGASAKTPKTSDAEKKAGRAKIAKEGRDKAKQVFVDTDALKADNVRLKELLKGERKKRRRSELDHSDTQRMARDVFSDFRGVVRSAIQQEDSARALLPRAQQGTIKDVRAGLPDYLNTETKLRNATPPKGKRSTTPASSQE